MLTEGGRRRRTANIYLYQPCQRHLSQLCIFDAYWLVRSQGLKLPYIFGTWHRSINYSWTRVIRPLDSCGTVGRQIVGQEHSSLFELSREPASHDVSPNSSLATYLFQYQYHPHERWILQARFLDRLQPPTTRLSLLMYLM